MPGSGRGAWGWHPLHPEWAQRIVAGAGIQPGDLVFDLGAGTGALTLPLIEAGADVVAIELHPRRVAALRRSVAGRAKVVQADLADLYLPRRPFRVVANPPFAITTQLVRTLLASRSLRSADLVLQRGAARGLAARPPLPRGPRALPRRQLQVGAHLPARAFTVPPAVTCAVLQVRSAPVQPRRRAITRR